MNDEYQYHDEKYLKKHWPRWLKKMEKKAKKGETFWKISFHSWPIKNDSLLKELCLEQKINFSSYTRNEFFGCYFSFSWLLDE